MVCDVSGNWLHGGLSIRRIEKEGGNEVKICEVCEREVFGMEFTKLRHLV